MRPDSHSRKIRLLTFGILAGATLLAADLLLSPTFAIGPAYVALLLISLWRPDRRSTVGIATVATALIVAAFFLTRADEGRLVAAAIDRGFTVLAIWAAVVLIVRWKGWATRSGRISAHRRASLRALGVQPEALDDVAAGHLISLQEDERKHFANELQRDLAPRLATAVLDVRALTGEASNATELLRSVEDQLSELKKRLPSLLGQVVSFGSQSFGPGRSHRGGVP